jgi:predicted Co/Zn/Cd cation transporter (cation efflux family)
MTSLFIILKKKRKKLREIYVALNVKKFYDIRMVTLSQCVFFSFVCAFYFNSLDGNLCLPGSFVNEPVRPISYNPVDY